MATGTAQGAMWGALAGAAAGGIGGIKGADSLTRGLMHGITQGGISKAGGGRFGDGALGAFASSMGRGMLSGLGRGVGQAMAAAAVGGTASVIGGGKFANGAISGAMVNMFNDQAPHGEPSGSPLRDLWNGFKAKFNGFAAEDSNALGLKDLPAGLSNEAMDVPVEAAAAALEVSCHSRCMVVDFVVGGVASHAAERGLEAAASRAPGNFLRPAVRWVGPVSTAWTVVRIPATYEQCSLQCP